MKPSGARGVAPPARREREPGRARRAGARTSSHKPAGLQRLTTRVNEALAKALDAPPGAPPVLDEAMRYCALSGGKRFRPLLCLGGCEAVGGEMRAALPVACAIELIHAYSLVHDDLPAMDDADQRRGRPSCHRKFGEATAILVGDALLTRAFEWLGSNGTPNLAQILRALGAAGGTSGLIGGQLLDLRSTQHAARSTVNGLEEIARRKTAALITASVVCGGLAGQASSQDARRLERYGQALGVAFQVIDDLHDGDGMARALGAEAAHRRAAELIKEATQALRPFGQRAWLLHELAEWLAESA